VGRPAERAQLSTATIASAAVGADRLAAIVRKLIGLVALLAVVGVVASGVADSSRTPVLTGPEPMDGQGFGQVKPRTVYLGGDESGIVCRIAWLSWGGKFAVGSGTSWYLGPHQFTYQGHWAPAVIVLYRLGTWDGRSAYKQYTWYFPGDGKGFGHMGGCFA
jgi:hypothetical protein